MSGPKLSSELKPLIGLHIGVVNKEDMKNTAAKCALELQTSRQRSLSTPASPSLPFLAIIRYWVIISYWVIIRYWVHAVHCNTLSKEEVCV